MIKKLSIQIYIHTYYIRSLSLSLSLSLSPWSSGSVLDHRSLPPVFESRRGHIWRLFRLLLRLITFGGRSAHLAYLVQKSGRKTSIIIISLSLSLSLWLCTSLSLSLSLSVCVSVCVTHSLTHSRGYTNGALV